MAYLKDLLVTGPSSFIEDIHGNNIYANSFIGSLNGNAATATKLATARSLQVALGSTTAVTFDGSADQNSIPVSGILAVSNGGTGVNRLIANYTLVGNETGGIKASSKFQIPVNDTGTITASLPLHLTNTTAATATLLSSQLIIGNSRNAPALELYRTESNSASWQLINDTGTFKIKNNYKNDIAGDYDNDSAFEISWKTGHVTVGGGIYPRTAGDKNLGSDTTQWNNIYANQYYIKSGSNSYNSITSDAETNIYFNIKNGNNNIIPLVITNTEVRRGISASAINLGSSTYKWANIYTSQAKIGDYLTIGASGTGNDAKTISSNNTLYINSGNACSIIFQGNSNNIAQFDQGASYAFRPDSNQSCNLGTSSCQWGALYIGTANSYGATNIPIYWNNGVPTAVNLNLTANNLINSLTTGFSTPADNDYFISQYINGGTSTTTYHRRPVSKLYEYIRDKAAASTSGMYSIIPTTNNTYNLGSSTQEWANIYAKSFKGNADTATAANITSTTNAIAYYTNTTGSFGSKASANGALYATSTNGTLQWGTLPIAQGGTGATTTSGAWDNIVKPGGQISSSIAASDTPGSSQLIIGDSRNKAALELYRTGSNSVSWQIINDNGTFKIKNNYKNDIAGDYDNDSAFSIAYRTGNVTTRGDLILYNSAGASNTPSLLFQRGTTSDGTRDWRFQVRSNILHIDSQYNQGDELTSFISFNEAGATTSFDSSQLSIKRDKNNSTSAGIGIELRYLNAVGGNPIGNEPASWQIINNRGELQFRNNYYHDSILENGYSNSPTFAISPEGFVRTSYLEGMLMPQYTFKNNSKIVIAKSGNLSNFTELISTDTSGLSSCINNMCLISITIASAATNSAFYIFWGGFIPWLKGKPYLTTTTSSMEAQKPLFGNQDNYRFKVSYKNNKTIISMTSGTANLTIPAGCLVVRLFPIGYVSPYQIDDD